MLGSWPQERPGLQAPGSGQTRPGPSPARQPPRKARSPCLARAQTALCHSSGRCPPASGLSALLSPACARPSAAARGSSLSGWGRKCGPEKGSCCAACLLGQHARRAWAAWARRVGRVAHPPPVAQRTAWLCSPRAVLVRVRLRVPAGLLPSWCPLCCGRACARRHSCWGPAAGASA